MTDKPAFIQAPDTPTQRINDEVYYDFNDGARVKVLESSKRPYHVELYDADSGITCYNDDVDPGKTMQSACRYRVNWRIVVKPAGGDVPLLDHTLDMRGRHVLVQCPRTKSPTIGDTIAIMSAAEQLRAETGADVHVTMHPGILDLFRTECALHAYDDYKGEPYSTVRMGLFWDDDDQRRAPVDHRLSGNFLNYRHIAGVSCENPRPPEVALGQPDIPTEPYACIGVQASAACKTWMGDGFCGWINLVKWLVGCGYRVLCIDKDKVYGAGVWRNAIPHGCEDFTGDIPLGDRAALLKHAAFFVGGSSGLAWLAWCVGCPVVMISGFTEDWNEFHTPYRVRSSIACSGCWNDPRHKFDHSNLLWCPRHQDDDGRRFECSRLISSELVKSAIRRIPGFLGG